MSMVTLQFLFLGFAPGLLWLWFFRRKDDLEPEPRLLLLSSFLLGGLSVFLVLWIRPHWEAVLLPPEPGWSQDLFDAFLITACGEEFCKLLVFFFGAYLLREFDEPLDGVIYGIAVGLGFASVENTFFLFKTGDPWVVVMRSFTATLGHVVFSGSLGFIFGIAKFYRPWMKIILMPAGLITAVFLHGCYDFFLFTNSNLKFLSLLLLLPLMLVLLAVKIRILRGHSHRFHSQTQA